jgi:hypothetical protein
MSVLLVQSDETKLPLPQVAESVKIKKAKPMTKLEIDPNSLVYRSLSGLESFRTDFSKIIAIQQATLHFEQENIFIECTIKSVPSFKELILSLEKKKLLDLNIDLAVEMKLVNQDDLNKFRTELDSLFKSASDFKYEFVENAENYNIHAFGYKVAVQRFQVEAKKMSKSFVKNQSSETKSIVIPPVIAEPTKAEQIESVSNTPTLIEINPSSLLYASLIDLTTIHNDFSKKIGNFKASIQTQNTNIFVTCGLKIICNINELIASFEKKKLLDINIDLRVDLKLVSQEDLIKLRDKLDSSFKSGLDLKYEFVETGDQYNLRVFGYKVAVLGFQAQAQKICKSILKNQVFQSSKAEAIVVSKDNSFNKVSITENTQVNNNSTVNEATSIKPVTFVVPSVEKKQTLIEISPRSVLYASILNLMTIRDDFSKKIGDYKASITIQNTQIFITCWLKSIRNINDLIESFEKKKLIDVTIDLAKQFKLASSNDMDKLRKEMQSLFENDLNLKYEFVETGDQYNLRVFGYKASVQGFQAETQKICKSILKNQAKKSSKKSKKKAIVLPMDNFIDKVPVKTLIENTQVKNNSTTDPVESIKPVSLVVPSVKLNQTIIEINPRSILCASILDLMTIRSDFSKKIGNHNASLQIIQNTKILVTCGLKSVRNINELIESYEKKKLVDVNIDLAKQFKLASSNDMDKLRKEVQSLFENDLNLKYEFAETGDHFNLRVFGYKEAVNRFQTDTQKICKSILKNQVVLSSKKSKKKAIVLPIENVIDKGPTQISVEKTETKNNSTPNKAKSIKPVSLVVVQSAKNNNNKAEKIESVNNKKQTIIEINPSSLLYASLLNITTIRNDFSKKIGNFNATLQITQDTKMLVTCLSKSLCNINQIIASFEKKKLCDVNIDLAKQFKLTNVDDLDKFGKEFKSLFTNALYLKYEFVKTVGQCNLRVFGYKTAIQVFTFEVNQLFESMKRKLLVLSAKSSTSDKQKAEINSEKISRPTATSSQTVKKLPVNEAISKSVQNESNNHSRLSELAKPKVVSRQTGDRPVINSSSTCADNKPVKTDLIKKEAAVLTESKEKVVFFINDLKWYQTQLLVKKRYFIFLAEEFKDVKVNVSDDLTKMCLTGIKREIESVKNLAIDILKNILGCEVECEPCLLENMIARPIEFEKMLCENKLCCVIDTTCSTNKFTIYATSIEEIQTCKEVLVKFNQF